MNTVGSQNCPKYKDVFNIEVVLYSLCFNMTCIDY